MPYFDVESDASIAGHSPFRATVATNGEAGSNYQTGHIRITPEVLLSQLNVERLLENAGVQLEHLRTGLGTSIFEYEVMDGAGPKNMSAREKVASTVRVLLGELGHLASKPAFIDEYGRD